MDGWLSKNTKRVFYCEEYRQKHKRESKARTFVRFGEYINGRI